MSWPGAAHVSPAVPTTRATREAVRMIAGPPRVHDESVIVPITWQPGDAVRRLSTIEADLRLTSLGGQRSRAALSGSYRVALPCSAVEFISARHLAESWLRSFLEHLEATLAGQRSTPTELEGDPGGQRLRTNGAPGRVRQQGLSAGQDGTFGPRWRKLRRRLWRQGPREPGHLGKELSCRILLHCSEARRSAPAQRW